MRLRRQPDLGRRPYILRATRTAGNHKFDGLKLGTGGFAGSTVTAAAVRDFGGNKSGEEAPLCLNCNGFDHFTACCPTIRCERPSLAMCCVCLWDSGC